MYGNQDGFKPRNFAPVNVGDDVEVTIEAVGDKGDGIAKIKGFVLTDISRDGMLQGLNIDLITNNLLLTNKPVIVGGGLSNYNDLKKLNKISLSNLEGVIAGSSFYLGLIEIKKGIQILKNNA